MATVTARLGAWADETIVANVTYNNANNAVASVTVTNAGPWTIDFTIWRTGDEANAIVRTVVPGPAQTFAVPANVRYSAVELPVGDPKAANFGYSALTYT